MPRLCREVTTGASGSRETRLSSDEGDDGRAPKRSPFLLLFPRRVRHIYLYPPVVAREAREATPTLRPASAASDARARSARTMSLEAAPGDRAGRDAPSPETRRRTGDADDDVATAARDLRESGDAAPRRRAMDVVGALRQVRRARREAGARGARRERARPEAPDAGRGARPAASPRDRASD